MSRLQRIAGAVLIAVTAALIASCGDKPTATAAAAGRLAIKGAGATFPQPLFGRWMDEYQKEHPEVTFTYADVGSGEGIRRFLHGSADFGASDAALSDAELAEVDPKRGAVMIPVTAGMVVLPYHIRGVGPGLVLTRDVYLDIFAGKIREWDDPRIVATNPDLGLPKLAIATVVRRDSSGTTFALTNHFAAVDPWWKTQGPGVGKLVDWPGSAMKAKGNEGVAQRVKITDGAIGYVGYEFAERLRLPMAALQNKDGAIVAPSPQAGQSALASVTEVPADLRVFVPDPDGTGSYPIVTYSWLLLGEHFGDPAKAEAMKGAVEWGLTKGQAEAARMGYVPLPAAMVASAREVLAGVQ